MGKKLNADDLSAIMDNSEMKENFSTPANEIQQSNSNIEVVRRSKNRVQYRNFSVSLEINDYNKFQQYLIDNDIRSGSALIRDLLKDGGIL